MRAQEPGKCQAIPGKKKKCDGADRSDEDKDSLAGEAQSRVTGIEFDFKGNIQRDKGQTRLQGDNLIDVRAHQQGP